jgi:hypothetical protein
VIVTSTMDAGGLDRALDRYDIDTRSGVATRRIIVPDRRTTRLDRQHDR